jgi:hypothetical protein
MRARTILAAALIAGISVACSKPGPGNGQTADAGSPTDDREIRLVDEPSLDAPVVSALEAGLAATLREGSSTLRTTSPSGREAGATSPKAQPEPGAEVGLPSLALTEMAAPATLVPSATSLPVRLAGTGMPAAARDAGHTTSAGNAPASGGTRGPVILIRGGMGTPHDDCKLHPVASRGVGIAINNVAPPIPGRVAVNSRLSGGNGGFTRIR